MVGHYIPTSVSKRYYTGRRKKIKGGGVSLMDGSFSITWKYAIGTYLVGTWVKLDLGVRTK